MKDQRSPAVAAEKRTKLAEVSPLFDRSVVE
jgi:hypothetical protein